MNSKYILSALLSFVIFSCQYQNESGSKDEVKFQDESHVVVLDTVSKAQHITSLPIPENLSFARERVPLERNDVREALEYELMVNSFRHSKTLKLIKTIKRWSPLILEILENENVPKDFIYLAVAESEFNPNARSYVGAMGMWQFMEATGKEYGLLKNKYVDMRRDPELSTNAACKYLKGAQSLFSSWTLAAASYNCGRSGLLRTMTKQGVDDFYDLHLNTETGRYIYRIIAFKLILENPEAYGYFVSEEEKYAPFEFTEVEVNKDIDNLPEFAKEQGTTYKMLRIYNPWFNNTSSYRLNVGRKKYMIRVPLSTKDISVIDSNIEGDSSVADN